MIVLARIGNPEPIGHDIEKRDRRDRYASVPIIGGDVKHRLVGSGDKHRIECGVIERSLTRKVAAREQAPPSVGIEREHFDPHAGSNDPARDVDDVDGQARHDLPPYVSWRVNPANRSAASISTKVTITITPDTAAVRTSRLVSICCQR